MDPGAREKFIKIFNQFPCLWDKSSPNFIQFQKKPDYRNEVWAEVSRRFIEEGINVSEDLLRKTWNHMRNYFIRYKLPFTASKNLTAVNHEEALHETLNNMSQTVLAAQFELKQEVGSQMEVEPPRTSHNTPKNSTVINIKQEPSTVAMEMKYMPSVVKPSVSAPSIPDKYSPTAPIATETASSSKKRAIPKEQAPFEDSSQETSFITSFTQPVERKSVEVQTDPDYLIRDPCRKKLPSLGELLSVRVTLSRGTTDRVIQLERRVEEPCSQYDEVYTDQMEMDCQAPPVPQHSFFTEDSYVLQSL